MGNSPYDDYDADEDHTGGLDALDFTAPGADGWYTSNASRP